MQPASRFSVDGYNGDSALVLSSAEFSELLKRDPKLQKKFTRLTDALEVAQYTSFFWIKYSKAIESVTCRIDKQHSCVELFTPNTHGLFQTIRIVDTSKPFRPINHEKRNYPLFAAHGFAHYLQGACAKDRPEVFPPLKVGSRSFTKGVYGTYRLKMREFAETLKSNYPLLFDPANKEEGACQDLTRTLIQLIFEFDAEKVADYKKNHKLFLNSLRGQIIIRNQASRTEYMVQARGFVDAINFWMYTNDVLPKQWFEALKSLIPDFDKLVNADFKSSCLSVYKAIVECPQISYAFYRAYSDCHVMGNLGARFFSIGETTFLRMPNQTYFEEADVCNVVPEMSNFAYILALKRFSMLYGNLMGTTGKEGMFSGCLHMLEYMNPRCKVVTIDKIQYYNFGEEPQSSVITNVKLAKELFIKSLMGGCLEDGSPFVFNNGMNQQKMEAYRLDLIEIVDLAHSKYYNSAGELKNEEWRALKDLVLVEVVYRMVKEGKFTFLTLACRATSDRGPSFFVLLYLRDLLDKKYTLTVQEVHDALMYLFVNAVIVENRPPHYERVNLLVDAADKIIKHGTLGKKENLAQVPEKQTGHV